MSKYHAIKSDLIYIDDIILWLEQQTDTDLKINILCYYQQNICDSFNVEYHNECNEDLWAELDEKLDKNKKSYYLDLIVFDIVKEYLDSLDSDDILWQFDNLSCEDYYYSCQEE